MKIELKKVKEYLDENPNVSLVSFGWSLFWRFLAIYLTVLAVLGLITVLFD